MKQDAKIGVVPNSWSVKPLESFLGLITYGFTNPMPTTEKGPFRITATNIEDGKIDYKNANHTTIDAYENDLTDKSRPKINDVLLTKDGSIGRSAVVDRPNICINQSVALLRTNEKILPTFLNYLLQAPYYQRRMTQDAGGSTIKHIYITRVDKMEVAVPQLDKQKQIVSILSAFDDLIENNTRRIEILEEMARRIYREWFVHFRYPGHEDDELVDSGTELGEIPEGWEVKKLSDVAKVNPENISTDYEGEIEYINISGVNEGSIDETEIHDFEDAPSRAKRKVDHGDIIWSSVRPNLKSYALVLNPPTNQIASTGFGVIRPKKLPSLFIYNYSTTEYFVQYLVNHTRGSAYPAVNVSDFKNAPILVPDEKLVEKFDEITWSNYLQIDKLSRQNKKLKETRDLLLPKLISGKIGVEEVKF